MWERWQKGESLQRIAQLFGRNHSSVQGILVETGGIRPAQRHRSQLALTLAEREVISRALVAGHSLLDWLCETHLFGQPCASQTVHQGGEILRPADR
ncbi:integrase catalytic subunit [Pandoraea terrae]|uniref:Integrase catalytic subunit n=1 Tax=Pandoraea terrae TaxID=1537710 RepID=A0A5E4UNP4_9BURK|nr:integrase catalytic subunit [Pandoraea terrae]